MSEKLATLLNSAAPGAYHLASRAGAATIAATAERQGRRCFHLDGRDIASKAEFLAACARAMGFPEYFGANWDALEDSLRDLGWAPTERGYLLLWDSAGVFAAAQPEEFGVALDILRGAIEFWRTTSTPMIVLLRGAGRAAGGTPRLR